MRKIIGIALIALGVFLEVTWLSVCFGSIIIGVLLLIKCQPYFILMLSSCFNL